MLLYITAFAMVTGPLPWLVCSEIFPAKLRGRAMSISAFLVWVACLIVAQTFPILSKTASPAATFWIYAACSAAAFLFVLLRFRETKSRTLEEIELSWRRKS